MDSETRRAARRRATIAFIAAGVLLIGNLIAWGFVREDRYDDRGRMGWDQHGPGMDHQQGPMGNGRGNMNGRGPMGPGQNRMGGGQMNGQGPDNMMPGYGRNDDNDNRNGNGDGNGDGNRSGQSTTSTTSTTTTTVVGGA